MDDDLDWLPEHGAHLTVSELRSIFELLRALVDGTDEAEPNRAHTVSIAWVISSAVERGGTT